MYLLLGANSKHSKLNKQLSHSTGYRSASSTTISNQFSATFSDQLRVTPVRSAPDGPSPYLHATSEPTFDKQRRRHKSPDRVTSREARCTTPNSLMEKRANSLEYIDRKQQNAFSASINIPSLHRATSLLPRPSQKQLVSPQASQRPKRPAPAPPDDCLYENLNTYQYPHLVPQVVQQENIYMNAPLEVDANGKPSLVPSIMTMQDRIQLLDKNPVHLPHSISDISIGQTSSLGDIHSVSEFNQNRRKSGLLKEDMV